MRTCPWTNSSSPHLTPISDCPLEHRGRLSKRTAWGDFHTPLLCVSSWNVLMGMTRMEVTAEMVSLLLPLLNFRLCTGAWKAGFAVQGHAFPPQVFVHPRKNIRCRCFSQHSGVSVMLFSLVQQNNSWFVIAREVLAYLPWTAHLASVAKDATKRGKNIYYSAGWFGHGEQQWGYQDWKTEPHTLKQKYFFFCGHGA